MCSFAIGSDGRVIDSVILGSAGGNTLSIRKRRWFPQSWPSTCFPNPVFRNPRHRHEPIGRIAKETLPRFARKPVTERASCDIVPAIVPRNQ